MGDSRACIYRKSEETGKYIAEWLTVDHKPNNTEEFQRIKKAGGIVAWKANKPYMRPGDFVIRQARGERPKQLNYSRAIGAKNLKLFGLICEPDINHFELSKEDKFVIIASDGLWDVFEPLEVLSIALDAKKSGKCIAQEILANAVDEMPNVNVCDNISILAISLNND